jgi:hypothetical protein
MLQDVISESPRLTALEQSQYDDASLPRPAGDHSVDDDFDVASRGTFSSYDDEDDEDDQSVGGGVWVEPGHDEEIETGKENARAFTAYDAQGVGHQCQTSHGGQTSVGGSEQSGWKTWGGIKAPKANENSARPKQHEEGKKRNDRWAKIKVSYMFYLAMPINLLDLRAVDSPKVPRRLCEFLRWDGISIP